LFPYQDMVYRDSENLDIGLRPNLPQIQQWLLFSIQVTKTCINSGESRDLHTCHRVKLGFEDSSYIDTCFLRINYRP
jgi:hypothetical protein